MLLKSFLGILVSGGIYDLIKIGTVGSTKELVLKLKEVFRKQPFSEKEYDKLADIIEKVDKAYLLTEDIFTAYLETSEELKEIVEKNKFSNNHHHQESHSSGNGSISSSGNNNTNTINNYNGIDNEKK